MIRIISSFAALALLAISAVDTAPNRYHDCQHNIVGAGIGGLYSAFQLINTSTVAADKICIFEKNQRIGGRIFSLKDDQGNFIADMAAASFYRGGEPIIESLVDAFGLNFTCYNYLHPACRDGKGYRYLRDTYGFREDGFRDSSYYPYQLRLGERWNRRRFARDPFDDFAAMLPLLSSLETELTSPDATTRWQAIAQLFDYMRNNPAMFTPNLTYGEINMRLGIYNETDWVRRSAEYYRFWAEIYGEDSEWYYYSNFYTLFSEAIFADYVGVDGGVEMVFVDGNGRPIGYDAPLQELKNRILQAGGRLFLGHEVVRVARHNADKIRLTITNSNSEVVTVTGVACIINADNFGAKLLSRDSVFWTETSQTWRRMFRRYIPTYVTKLYLYYDDAWWITKLGIRTGDFATDEPTRNVELAQASIQCEDDVRPKKGAVCRGWIQVSYVAGVANAVHWDTANYNATDAPIWLSNRTDDSTRPVLLEAHLQFVKTLQPQLQEENISPDSINLPSQGVAAVWPDGWTYIPANNFPVGTMNFAMRKPIPDLPLCFVNTDFSPKPGYAEGSLVSALECLKIHYNITVPEIPSAYYQYLVNGFY